MFVRRRTREEKRKKGKGRKKRKKTFESTDSIRVNGFHCEKSQESVTAILFPTI